MTHRRASQILLRTIIAWIGAFAFTICGETRAEAQVTLSETPLGPLTATGGGGHYQFQPIITKDADHTFVIASKGSRVQAFVDGQPGPLVTEIPTITNVKNLSPAFSADGKAFGYIAGVENGKKVVIVNGSQSPTYDVVPWFSFAPAGHHFAYSVTKQVQPGQTGTPGSYMVDNGKAGLIYTQVYGDSAGFSPDGEHFAYVAVGAVDRNARGPIGPSPVQPQTWRVVVDGVEQPLRFLNIATPIFSKNSKHMGYLAGTNGFTLTRAVFDGKEGPAYDLVEQLVISDDGSRYAYIAAKGTGFNGRRVVVDNGAEGAPYNTIQNLVISPDGKRIAYIALNGTGQSIVVENGKPGTQYTQCSNLRFSPDSKTLLYTATSAAGQFVVANGQEIGPFTQVNPTLAFSDDGQHWALWTSPPAGGWSVVHDGKTIPLNPGIGPGTLSFQQGSGRLFMKASNSGTGAPAVVEIGAAPIPALEVPSDVVYSRNLQHVVKVTTTDPGSSRATQQIAIDGNPPSPQKYVGLRKVAISDDGKHVAFIGTRADAPQGSQVHAILDGKEGPGFRSIVDLAMSPDGQHIAYLAEVFDGKNIVYHVILDGMQGPVMQDVLPLTSFQDGDIRLRFRPDGSLYFLAFFDGQLHRCTYPASAFTSLPSMASVETEKPGLKVLHKWEGPGRTAIRIVLGADQTIYGISIGDGKFDKGSLWKMKTDGSDFAVLHDFFGGDADGEQPISLVMEPDGKLLGALSAGKVFRYDPKSKEYALVEITKRDYGPTWIVGRSASGKIIGMGGAAGRSHPNLFSIAPNGSGYTTINNTQSGQPMLMYEQIIPAKDGGFFAINNSTLVKFGELSDTAAAKVIHKFVNSPTDGTGPESNMILDSKGNLYGTTRAGGMSQRGIVYRVDADGSNYKVIHNPDKADFDTKLIAAGDDGKVYGLTPDGLLVVDPGAPEKPATQVVAFQGKPDMNFQGFSNVVFNEGVIYAVTSKAIYRVPVGAPSGGPAAAAVPTVAMKTVPPPLAALETIAFTEPAGTAAPSNYPPAARGPQQTPPAPQQPTAQPPSNRGNQPQNNPASQPAQNRGNDLNRAQQDLQRANDAANRLRGLLRGQ